MSRKSGQVAILVLLILLLGLTVGLAATSRTIQDLKQSAVSDQSTRAFSAAEAGIEAGLNNLAVGTTTVPVGGTTVTYNVARPTGDYTPDGAIGRDDVVALDLTGYSVPINIYWTSTKAENAAENPASCTESSAPAALELSFFTKGTSNNYGLVKRVYNTGKSGCSLSSVNNFLVSSASDDAGYISMRKNESVPTNTVLLRIRPIYNAASIRVTGSGLPGQSYIVTSTAQTTGGVARSIQVSRAISTPPPIFDYAVFGGDITK